MKQKFYSLFFLLSVGVCSYLNACETASLTLSERKKLFGAAAAVKSPIPAQRKSETSNKSDQVIKITNNTNQHLDLNLNVPGRTTTVITMTKLTSLQEILHKAILDDSENDIHKAVKAGADVNKPKEGKTPLMWAILLKRSNAVKAILSYDVLNINDENVDTSLIDISKKLGDFKSALHILQKMNTGVLGKNKNYFAHRNHLFLILLRASVEQADLQATTFLLKNSTNLLDKNLLILNDQNEKNNTVVMGYIINLLADNPNRKSVSINALLEVIQELINRGYNVNNIWNDALINNGHNWLYSQEKILELFIRNGANPHYRIGNQAHGTYPIFKAIQCGNAKAVKILVEQGAFINETNVSFSGPGGYPFHSKKPLAYAIELGKADIVQLLLEYGAKL